MRSIFTLLLFVFSISAFSGGSQVALQGIKAQGMGHAGAALAWDASTIFFNPGAMAFTGRKFDFTFGINGVEGVANYRAFNGNYSASTDNDISTPFNAYIQGTFYDRVSVGIGVYNPFGSSIKWEEGWSGRYLIQEIGLRSFYIQPTISVKVTEWLGIGAGFVKALGSVYLEKDIPVQSQNGMRSYVALEGDAESESYNLGLFITPTDWLNIGVSYRAGANFKLKDGDAKFYTSEFLEENFPPENKFDGELPLPATTALSIALKPNEKLTISAEYNRTEWGVYDTLRIDFENNTESLEDINDPKLYQDAYQIRLGINYAFNDWLQVRGGYVFDKTPIQANFYGPETPDMDRSAVAAGATIGIGKNLDLDLAYTYVRGQQYEATYEPANFGGTYRTTVNIASVGLSIHF